MCIFSMFNFIQVNVFEFWVLFENNFNIFCEDSSWDSDGNEYIYNDTDVKVIPVYVMGVELYWLCTGKRGMSVGVYRNKRCIGYIQGSF